MDDRAGSRPAPPFGLQSLSHLRGSFLPLFILLLIVGGALLLMILVRRKHVERDPQASLCQMELEQLKKCLEGYGARYGVIPPPIRNADLARVLSATGKSNETYLDAKSARLSAAGELLDPWNRPYLIRAVRPVTRVPSIPFEFYSAGPDGIDAGGAEDDIAPGR